MGYIGKIPSAVPLTSADITDNVITSAKIVDGTITNTDVASSIITGQTAETSIAGGDSILIYDDSATALRKMTRTNFVAGIGGTNTPAFSAKIGTAQSIANATATLLAFDTEEFDTDNAYTNTASNYKFTVPSGKAGKYLIIISVRCQHLSSRKAVDIVLNGSNLKSFENAGTSAGDYDTIDGSFIRELSVGDYIQLKLYQDSGASQNARTDSFFQMYKLIE